MVELTDYQRQEKVGEGMYCHLFFVYSAITEQFTGSLGQKHVDTNITRYIWSCV